MKLLVVKPGMGLLGVVFVLISLYAVYHNLFFVYTEDHQRIPICTFQGLNAKS